MIVPCIILVALAIAIIYYSFKAVIVCTFRQMAEKLSDEELKELRQDLYDELDDYGWNWRTAVKYQTAMRMLQERGKVC